MKAILPSGQELTITRRANGDFMLQGLPTNPRWITPGAKPEEHWCKVGMTGGIFGGDYTQPGHQPADPWVSCFGGEVWPDAWPELFTPPLKGNYACGPNHLTPLGLDLLTQALNEATQGEPPDLRTAIERKFNL